MGRVSMAASAEMESPSIEVFQHSLYEHFGSLPDHRVDRTKEHKLFDIIFIAICGVISGADGWTSIETYGKSKYLWLKSILELPGGIPSHDTFGRVFSMIDPEQLQQCFINWVTTLSKLTKGLLINIDGKTLRRSFDEATQKKAIHMISAWASGNGLVLGQLKVDDKSNEITAIPALLKLLDISGSIITIDAMGCRRDIAAHIVRENADYVLALKGNLGTLHDDVKLFFQDLRNDLLPEFKHQFHETVDAEHGRLEVRRYWVVSDIDWLPHKNRWEGDRGGMVTGFTLVFIDVSESVPWRECFDEHELAPGAMPAGARGKEWLTQKQLSELTGIPQRHISEMENGKRPIGKEMAGKLAKALHIGYKVFL